MARDRRAHLWRLGDTLDELLCLIARQDPLPQPIDEIAVEDANRRPLYCLALESTIDAAVENALYDAVDA